MNTTLPQVLETKLAEFRRRVWIVKLAEGVLAALFGIALSYLLVFVLDRFMETPPWLRLTFLIGAAATLGLGLPLKWHRWVWRQRRLEDAARLLRRTFPRLGDQLLGIVELARMDHATEGRSERLVQAAMEQAADAVKDQDFTRAVPHARHRQWGWAAAGVIALAVVGFTFVPDAARNAFARWLTPWRAVERYTFAQVEPLPAQLVVPYAEPFVLPVRLTSNSQFAPSETRARIGEQPPVRAALASGAYPLSFPPQKQDAALALSLGDVRKEVLVQPRPRPELSELAVRLRLPSYLQYASEPRIGVHGGSVSVLKGAEAAFDAKATRPLTTAELDGTPQQVAGERITTSYLPVAGDGERKFTWKDADGLTPREPLVLKVRAVEDEAPKILARRETQEQVVLDSEVVTFDLTASDDFGVKRTGLEWSGAPSKQTEEPDRGERVAAAGKPEQKALEARATFCALRDGVAPQTIELRAWAEDYLPERKRARSASFILHILNKTDHALWLTDQFGKWLEVARESYEREQQLHETNKELRGLSAAELERPENRRKVSQQAAAENANAARLDALTTSGRNLVEQATKNDEFEAARLESWATMLKSLKDIAANRMPSVADLLKKTAGAPAGKLASSPTDSSPSVGKNDSKPAPGQPANPSDPKPAVPSISDRENGFNKAGELAAAKPNDKPPGAPKFGLPSTTLAGAPKKDDGTTPPPAETPAQEKLDAAVQEQKDLLAEFAKVSDELSEILASLEASTFVKRFKAASRQQLALATDISQKTLEAFGIERTPVKAAEPIAKHAKDQSDVVRVIQSDLDAYFQRKQDSRFKAILDEMKKEEIVRSLARSGEKVTVNLSGQSIVGSEFWGDILDRWAEELVAASQCKSSSTCSGDSLPPEIVLKVMQALRDEMKLRDQTRELENAKPALEEPKFTCDATALAEQQTSIGRHTAGAMEDIRALPDGEKRFGKELRLLTAVTAVMGEAGSILASADTGAKAVAAETEAIELLLQAKRMGNGGGGGGGSSPGGGGTAARASSAALADLGPGNDAATAIAARATGQATGHAGKEFPEEFKTGLDAYFTLLESEAGK
jgi:hypothetical protein